MTETQEWLWLVKTAKGNFFMTVVGKWTQEEAATRVRGVFHVILKQSIISMIPRKRATGPIDMTCSIIEQQPRKDTVGFNLYAGKKVWQLCGKIAEYEAQRILVERSIREEKR